MNYKIIILKSTDTNNITRTNINEFWFCRMLKGSAKVLFNLKKHKIGSDTLFVVPEGAQFRVVSSTRNMAMEILIFDEPLMNVVYTLLGAEADFGSLESEFWNDKGLEEPFSQLMALDYEALRVSIQHPSLVARNKAITASLAHLLLTIYNAVILHSDEPQEHGSHSSRMILNRFYELVSNKVSSGERSTNYYAAKLCISERYLFAVCKKETGQSPKEIINNFLIGTIKNVLLTSDLTLQQIADRLCFPDQSSFGQYFKRQEGISPSEFRQKYK